MSDGVDSSTAVRPAPRAHPVRTCVGCRERAVASDLVRVVAVEHEGRWSLEVDLRGRLPGRGAHVHPRSECVDQAERRRAFARALRVPGPVDTAALHERLTEVAAPPQDADRRAASAPEGSEQGMTLR